MAAVFHIEFNLIAPPDFTPGQVAESVRAINTILSLQHGKPFLVSDMWFEGQRVHGIVHRNSGITVVKSDQIGDSLSEALVDALHKVAGYQYNVGDVTFEREIACTVYVSDVMPSINLSNDLLQKIAELGASLDIDIIRTSANGGARSNDLEI